MVMVSLSAVNKLPVHENGGCNTLFTDHAIVVDVKVVLPWLVNSTFMSCVVLLSGLTGLTILVIPASSLHPLNSFAPIVGGLFLKLLSISKGKLFK